MREQSSLRVAGALQLCIIRRRTLFVVVMNNSAAVIVKIIKIMTIIHLLFRDQAMFAAEQSLQEPMSMLNLFWYEAARQR
jgi:hypothetical protein